MPFFLNGMVAGANVTLEAGRRYVVFVNTDLIDFERFSSRKFPKEVVAILPIRIPEGKTIDDAIRMYESEIRKNAGFSDLYFQC